MPKHSWLVATSQKRLITFFKSNIGLDAQISERTSGNLKIGKLSVTLATSKFSRNFFVNKFDAKST